MIKTKQNKTNFFIFAIILILAILALFIFNNLTGKVIQNPAQVSVTRISEKNFQENTTDVRLGIVSSENIVALQEIFLNNSCFVFNYSVAPEVDITDFDPITNIWVLANDSDNLITEIFYSIPYNCDVDVNNSFFYTLNNTKTQDTDTDTGSTSSSSSSSGGGGGGGSSIISNQTTANAVQISTTANAQQNTITNTETIPQYNKEVAKAKKALTQSESYTRNIIIIIVTLAVIALGIVVFFVVSFIRKPKYLDEQV